MYNSTLAHEVTLASTNSQQSEKCVPFPVQNTFSLGPVHSDLRPSELEVVLSQIDNTKVWSESLDNGITQTYFINHQGSVLSVQAPIDETSGHRYIRFSIQNTTQDPVEWVNARIEYITSAIRDSYLMQSKEQLRPKMPKHSKKTIFGTI